MDFLQEGGEGNDGRKHSGTVMIEIRNTFEEAHTFCFVLFGSILPSPAPSTVSLHRQALSATEEREERVRER